MWPVYGLLCEQLTLLKWPACTVDHWWHHAHRPYHDGVYWSDHGNGNRYCRTVWLNAKNQGSQVSRDTRISTSSHTHTAHMVFLTLKKKYNINFSGALLSLWKRQETSTSPMSLSRAVINNNNTNNNISNDRPGLQVWGGGVSLLPSFKTWEPWC